VQSKYLLMLLTIWLISVWILSSQSFYFVIERVKNAMGQPRNSQ